MANFFATIFLHIILAASGMQQVPLSAALAAEKSMPGLMRRDAPQELHVRPSGEMVAMVKGQVEGGEVNRRNKESNLKKLVPEGCNDVFPYGVDNSDGCEGSGGIIIEDDGKCKEAATAMNKTWPRTAVLKGEEWETVRPKGCFEFHCSWDPNERCLFYNERDAITGRTITGTPVCLKEKYVNGTAKSGFPTECPPGYENMQDEFAEGTCRTAGICLGYCEGDEFREELQHVNASNMFPQGCFIHAQWGCVYYNNVTSTPPANPLGTPICKAVEASGPFGATISPGFPHMNVATAVNAGGDGDGPAPAPGPAAGP